MYEGRSQRGVEGEGDGQKDGVPVVIKFSNQRNQNNDWLGLEGEHLNNLSSTAFPSFHGFGKYHDRPFIAMSKIDADPFISWLELKDWAKKLKVTIIKQLAFAVVNMHENKIVHRDLSPQNIMISKHTFQPVIFDFGMAVSMDVWGNPECKIDYEKMGSGGTLGFVSPEQATADPKSVGVKCDVFQLGTLLLYAFEGERLFAGVDQEERLENTKAYRINESAVTRFRKENPLLAPVFDKAIARDPKLRFRTAKEFARALADCENAMSPISHPWSRRTNTIAWCAAGALIAALIISLFFANWSASEKGDGIPKQFAALCRDNGVDPTEITKENFSVKIRLDKHGKNYLPHPDFGLRSEIGTEYSFEFTNIGPDIPLHPAYRVFPREWKPVLGGTSKDKDGNSREFHGIIEARDLESEGPLQVKMESRVYEDGQFVVGPFDFEIDIMQAIEKAYEARERQEIYAVRDSPVLVYKSKGLYASSGGWQWHPQTLKHRYAFSKIWVGKSKDSLDRYVNFLECASGRTKKLSWHREFLYPDELDRQLSDALRELEFSPVVYTKVEWVDGTVSEVRRHGRNGDGFSSKTKWSVVQDLMEKMDSQNELTSWTRPSSKDAVAALHLRFGEVAGYIDRIEYGGAPTELELSAKVDFRLLKSKNEFDQILKGELVTARKGFKWNVVDGYAQNAIPVPTIWKDVYFQVIGANGERSKVFSVKPSHYSPGLRLECDDQSAPRVYLCYSMNGHRLLWYSENEDFIDMAWTDGQELENAGYSDKRILKKIDLKQLDDGLFFQFIKKNGSQAGPYKFEYEDKDLRRVFAERALLGKERFDVAAISFVNCTEKSIEEYMSRQGNNSGGKILKQLVDAEAKDQKTIRGIYANSLYSLSTNRYAWAGLSKIRIGKTKSAMTLAHDINIPMDMLINGSEDWSDPLFVIKVPADFADHWVQFVYFDGTESEPFQMQVSPVNLRIYESN